MPSIVSTGLWPSLMMLGVIATLRVDSYMLVGRSMGSATARLLASRRPTGLRGLALGAPSPPSPGALSDEQRESMLHVCDCRESVACMRDHLLRSYLSATRKRRR